MAKNGTRSPLWGILPFVVFAAFSGAVALGWLRGADLYLLRIIQGHASSVLDAAAVVLSLPGGAEVSGVGMLVLLAGLLLCGRRGFAGRLFAVFVAANLVELAMKMFLPQAPLPGEAERAGDFAPVVAVFFPYSYPSGHAIRVFILLGALYVLSGSRLVRAGLLLVLLGSLASRVYLGVHWTSDVVGGALLGVAALSFAFRKEGREWRSR